MPHPVTLAVDGEKGVVLISFTGDALRQWPRLREDQQAALGTQLGDLCDGHRPAGYEEPWTPDYAVLPGGASQVVMRKMNATELLTAQPTETSPWQFTSVAPGRRRLERVEAEQRVLLVGYVLLSIEVQSAHA